MLTNLIESACSGGGRGGDAQLTARLFGGQLHRSCEPGHDGIQSRRRQKLKNPSTTSDLLDLLHETRPRRFQSIAIVNII